MTPKKTVYTAAGPKGLCIPTGAQSIILEQFPQDPIHTVKVKEIALLSYLLTWK